MIYPIWSSQFTIQETWTIFKAAPTLSAALGLLIISLSAIFFPPLHATLLVLIVWGSILDIRTHIIPDILLIAIATILITYECPSLRLLAISGILVCALIIIKSMFHHKNKANHLGWGDIKFLAISLPFLSFETLPIFFIVSGSLAITTHLALRKKEIPLFPILGSSFFILFI